jgi:uncharacterized Fe-S cluster-containing radical SAM superfamily protein
MRKELEPNIETAEKLYPKIVGLIKKYTEYCDENGDEDDMEYKKLENKLNEITGKDMSEYNLWEYYEEEGIEVLSFKISLPEPNIVNDISKEELFEIVKILKEDIFEENDKNKFMEEFNCHLGDYYHKLLEINFKGYTNEYFNRQKGKDGKYFEYTIEEIVEKIWNKEIKLKNNGVRANGV